MSTKTIKLSSPVMLHGESVSEIKLKEPKGGILLDVGEPRIWAQTKDGALYSVEDKDAIKAYLNECVEHENGAHLICLLSLKDIRAVKAALFSFFDTEPETTSG